MTQVSKNRNSIPVSLSDILSADFSNNFEKSKKRKQSNFSSQNDLTSQNTCRQREPLSQHIISQDDDSGYSHRNEYSRMFSILSSNNKGQLETDCNPKSAASDPLAEITRTSVELRKIHNKLNMLIEQNKEGISIHKYILSEIEEYKTCNASSKIMYQENTKKIDTLISSQEKLHTSTIDKTEFKDFKKSLEQIREVIGKLDALLLKKNDHRQDVGRKSCELSRIYVDPEKATAEESANKSTEMTKASIIDKADNNEKDIDTSSLEKAPRRSKRVEHNKSELNICKFKRDSNRKDYYGTDIAKELIRKAREHRDKKQKMR